MRLDRLGNMEIYGGGSGREGEAVPSGHAQDQCWPGCRTNPQSSNGVNHNSNYHCTAVRNVVGGDADDGDDHYGGGGDLYDDGSSRSPLVTAAAARSYLLPSSDSSPTTRTTTNTTINSRSRHSCSRKIGSHLRLLTFIALVLLTQLTVNISIGEAASQILNKAEPLFITRSEAFKFAVGDTIALPCEVSSPGSYMLAWKRGIAILTAGSTKVTPDPRVRLVNGYTLQILDASQQDAGDYICQMATMNPREITHHVEILVPSESFKTSSGVKNMAPVVDNNQFELPTALETPSKKRKRHVETNPFLSFSDQTFSIPSSTPIHSKQIDGNSFENPSFRFGANSNNGSNKENYNIFSDSCMEVKSIAEIAAENPFEVIRKPPSKKKRKFSEIEESCFVNPGLNLDAVDKPAVNPFEIIRENDDTGNQENESCFVNGALNIKGKDGGEAVNPFEISRPIGKSDGDVEKKKEVDDCKGIENPALEIPTYALAVPFTPSINHRINFQELPADALTPCQMLAKNLVFTPEPNPDSLITPKKPVTASLRKSLSVISEEPLDIGEELDCYQLELENSINEAKVLKQKSVRGSTGTRTKTRRSLIDVKHISNLSLKLKQLEESEGDEDEPKPMKEDEGNQEGAPAVEQPQTPPTPQPRMTFTVTKETTVKEEIRIDVSNPDVQFEEVDDFEDEEQDVDLFANPAPFQRAYRKKEDPNVEDHFKQPALPEPITTTKSHKVKDVIRRSFRKLIHPKQHQEPQVQITDLDEKPKSEESHHGFISSIRHSLRRKTHKSKETQQKSDENSEEDEAKELEMSVIVEAPRSVFRQPSADEYRTIAAGGSMDKVGSTLRSSLRRSTKDMKRQMMKNVFKKAGEEK